MTFIRSMFVHSCILSIKALILYKENSLLWEKFWCGCLFLPPTGVGSTKNFLFMHLTGVGSTKIFFLRIRQVLEAQKIFFLCIWQVLDAQKLFLLYIWQVLDVLKGTIIHCKAYLCFHRRCCEKSLWFQYWAYQILCTENIMFLLHNNKSQLQFPNNPCRNYHNKRIWLDWFRIN